MWHLAIAKNILINNRPRLVISPDGADPRTRIYCLLARQLKIPSLEVQFGLYGPESVEWQFFIANQLAVWGETSLGIMLDHGVPPKSIKITGSPRHDFMAVFSGTSSTYKLQTSNTTVIPQRTLTILFASTYSLGLHDTINPDALKSTKKAVFNLCSQANLNLIVKPHPLEDPLELEKLAAGMQRVTIADPSEDIRELIKKCDCFITLGSTATTDAIIARKLVIQPFFNAKASCSDIFSKSGAILLANSIEEFDLYLQEALMGSPEKLLNKLESARQEFLLAWLFKVDGGASRRVAKLGLEMAGI
jgi:CDP-glycerol glycerophosphotransferase (TagB/SpsB family)